MNEDFEQMYQIGTQSGSIKWDIQALKKSIDENTTIVEYDVEWLVLHNPFNGDEEYAMTTDVSIPGIVVELAKRKYKLIDGNHRLFKASRLGCETFRCYLLTEKEHFRFTVDVDYDTYCKVTEEF